MVDIRAWTRFTYPPPKTPMQSLSSVYHLIARRMFYFVLRLFFSFFFLNSCLWNDDWCLQSDTFLALPTTCSPSLFPLLFFQQRLQAYNQKMASTRKKGHTPVALCKHPQLHKGISPSLLSPPEGGHLRLPVLTSSSQALGRP